MGQKDAVVAGMVNTLVQMHAAELLQMREHWNKEARRGKGSEAVLWVEAIDLMLSLHERLTPNPPILPRRPGAPLPAAATLFRGFVEDYLAYVRSNFAAKTLENARRVVKLLLPIFGERDLSSFSAEDLEQFKAMRLQSGVSRTTVNIDVRTVKAAFNVAVDWKKIDESPFRRTKLLKIDQKPKRILSPEEFCALTSAIKEPWLRDIVSFNALTGLRLGEIMNLKWTDYNVERGEITVKSSREYRVKGGKMRVIPLTHDARQILDRRKVRGSEWIFTGERGKRYTADYVSKLFKRYLRALHLPEELHYHRLRDTFCTWLAERNVPIHIIKALAGHSTVRVTEGYLEANPEAMKREVSKIHLP